MAIKKDPFFSILTGYMQTTEIQNVMGRGLAFSKCYFNKVMSIALTPEWLPYRFFPSDGASNSYHDCKHPWRIPWTLTSRWSTRQSPDKYPSGRRSSLQYRKNECSDHQLSHLLLCKSKGVHPSNEGRMADVSHVNTRAGSLLFLALASRAGNFEKLL